MRLIHTFASYFAFQNNQNALTSSILSQNSGIVIVERQMYRLFTLNRSLFQFSMSILLPSDSGIGFQ
jgi:hypothetical protein